MKVLLIEGNNREADRICTNLREVSGEQFQVKAVSRLQVATQQIRREPVDVILINLSLPDVQGLNAIQQLFEHTSEIPVIVLIRPGEEDLAGEAVRLGAQDYLYSGECSGHLVGRVMHYAIERNRMQSMLRGLSMVDGQTGVYNRRAFLTLAKQQILLAERGKPGLLLLFDVNGMGQINQSHGYEEGNRTLVGTAELLRGNFRRSDIVARLEGNEFAVLAVEAVEESLSIMLERFERGLKAYNGKCHAERGYRIALTVGAVRYGGKDSDEELTIEDLLVAVHAELKQKKESRKRAYELEHAWEIE